MRKLVLWVGRHKLLSGLGILFLFAIPLIATHFLFKSDSGNMWLSAEWSAGELLAYVAGFEAFIGTVLLGTLALYQNQQVHRQHIESLAPALSMKLISLSAFLYLTIENTGQSEAKNIQLTIEKLENNSSTGDLLLDGLFFSTFDLYPNESVQGRVALSAATSDTEIFPQITVVVKYFCPILNEEKNFIRRVIFDNGYARKVTADVNIDFEKANSNFGAITRAVVRAANYLDGKQVAAFDELNICAGKSLKDDMMEVFKNKENACVSSEDTVHSTSNLSAE